MPTVRSDRKVITFDLVDRTCSRMEKVDQGKERAKWSPGHVTRDCLCCSLMLQDPGGPQAGQSSARSSLQISKPVLTPANNNKHRATAKKSAGKNIEGKEVHLIPRDKLQQ